MFSSSQLTPLHFDLMTFDFVPTPTLNAADMILVIYCVIIPELCEIDITVLRFLSSLQGTGITGERILGK